MRVLGLTGGIASGKSTAAAQLKELGVIVLDADRYGHRVYEPDSSGFHAVVNEFGHDIVGADGEIDRRILGGKVFGAPEKMDRLTDIVWPEIRRIAAEEIAELREREPETVIVLEAAVMIEAGWQDLCDEVWVIATEPTAAIKRLKDRNGLNPEQAQARLDSQLTNRERRRHAKVYLDNSGTARQFRQQVEQEWLRLHRRIKQADGRARAQARREAEALAAEEAAEEGAAVAKGGSSQ